VCVCVCVRVQMRGLLGVRRRLLWGGYD